MATYEQLKAWQVSQELALAVYAATDAWPKAELFGLTSQARRAVHSVAANIAEGYAKRGGRELRRYLDISLGSLAELEGAGRPAGRGWVPCLAALPIARCSPRAVQPPL